VKTLEALYVDSAFNEQLTELSEKNLLPFDDYRQEVFLYLAENGIMSGSDLRRIAKRIAMRMRRKQVKEQSVSLDAIGDFSYDDEFPSVLWEDNHIIA